MDFWTIYFFVALIGFPLFWMMSSSKRRSSLRTRNRRMTAHTQEVRRSDMTCEDPELQKFFKEENIRGDYFISGDYIEEKRHITVTWRNTLMRTLGNDLWLYYIHDYPGLYNGTASPEFINISFHLPDILEIVADVPPYDNVPAYMIIHVRRNSQESREVFEFHGKDRTQKVGKTRDLILHAREVCIAKQYN